MEVSVQSEPMYLSAEAEDATSVLKRILYTMGILPNIEFYLVKDDQALWEKWFMQLLQKTAQLFPG